MQNINILLFVHFKLQALHLSKVGLLTTKHQHSKNLTRWTESTWTKHKHTHTHMHGLRRRRRQIDCPRYRWVRWWGNTPILASC